MNNPFDGKSIIITGASAGIGRLLAIELAKRGGRLTLAARSVDKLEEVCDSSIADYNSFIDALRSRHDYFHQNGCRLSDHGLKRPYGEEFTEAAADAAFRKALGGTAATGAEAAVYKSALLYDLGLMYAEHDWTPTKDDLSEFDDKCRELGLDGNQWFSWRGAKALGYLGRLASFDWPVDEPPDPEDCDDQVAAAVAEVRAEYEALVQALRDDLDGMNEKLAAEYLKGFKAGWNEGLDALVDLVKK
jgi:NAD(P)-dependent dehydrogenase (short-subunit alcohol dehydrogenase family)